MADIAIAAGVIPVAIAVSPIAVAVVAVVVSVAAVIIVPVHKLERRCALARLVNRVAKLGAPAGVTRRVALGKCGHT
jgi:hypothetical protein